MDLSSLGLTIKAEIYKSQDLVTVYRTINLATSQQLAVKQIKLWSRLPFDQCIREAQTMQQASHPNIVQLVDTYLYPSREVPEFLLIITPYFPEGDLAKEINRRNHERSLWSEAELFHLMWQLVDAFAYLETQQIAHRDIKPQNIFVSHDHSGNQLLLVGGFDRSIPALQQQRQMRTVVGTPLYLSPALRRAYVDIITRQASMHADHNVYKSDVYSLGLVFYEMATLQGIHHFGNLSNLQQFINQHLHMIDSPSIRHLIGNMLEVDEAQRPTFGTLLQEFRRLWQQSNSPAVAIPPVSETTRAQSGYGSVRSTHQAQIQELVNAVNAEGFAFFSRVNALQYIIDTRRFRDVIQFQVMVDQNSFSMTLQSMNNLRNRFEEEEEAIASKLLLFDCLGFRITAKSNRQQPLTPQNQFGTLLVGQYDTFSCKRCDKNLDKGPRVATCTLCSQRFCLWCMASYHPGRSCGQA